MKKLFYLLLCISVMVNYSCEDKDNEYVTYPVSVQLAHAEGQQLAVVKDISVKLTNSSGSVYESKTNESGVADFTVPVGIYEASATARGSSSGYSFLYNGIKSNITVTDGWTNAEPVKLELSESRAGQLLIKEVYNGGCKDNDGAKNFIRDQYVIIYNNSDLEANLKNLCLGITTPQNAQATNKDYVNGKLIYEDEKWIPAGGGFCYFPQDLTIQPYGQVVVAIRDAVNHTTTYNNSIDFANKDYYCIYDPTVYRDHAAPSEVIPTSHYLKAQRYNNSSAWILSVSSPAFFIFQTKDTTPEAFGTDVENINYHGGDVSIPQIRKRVPVDWIHDAIEVFTTSSDKNVKRLTSTVDAGYVYFTNYQGYTLYRNVDKEATEAIEGNKEKLVYNYNMGTEGSTDPSGIDAEASIKNGASIIYMDTNNSTNDFHQRRRASLKD